ncbi:hypothetical protein LCL61_08795 [Amycolatopsis coloradensis]|uniref:Uncharacterized protein n=1 Tax=Amycolatopsis coloradensis TaxID=76021 RepID=A0ACD5B8H4_9PSEU
MSQPLWAQTATNGTGLLTPPVAVAPGSVIAAHRHNGDGQHLTRPMDTLTSTYEEAMLLVVANFQGSLLSAPYSLPTQAGLGDVGMVLAGVVPFRQNTIPTMHAEAMPTVTSDH